MKKQRWQLALTGLVCLLSFLASCGTNLGGDQPVSHLLTVTRTSALSANRFPPFAKAIDDSASATKLYNAIKALPPFQGVYSCPADDGLQYQLTFALKGATVQKIIASASGCRSVTLNQSDIRMTNEAFWSLFAQTLGVSEAELFPRPLSNYYYNRS